MISPSFLKGEKMFVKYRTYFAYGPDTWNLAEIEDLETPEDTIENFRGEIENKYAFSDKYRRVEIKEIRPSLAWLSISIDDCEDEIARLTDKIMVYKKLMKTAEHYPIKKCSKCEHFKVINEEHKRYDCLKDWMPYNDEEIEKINENRAKEFPMRCIDMTEIEKENEK